MRLELESKDLVAAHRIVDEQRARIPHGYRYDDYAHNAPTFLEAEFEATMTASIALECRLRKLLGVPPRPSEDFQADLPGGVEVTCRHFKNSRGDPYLVERRKVAKPTITGFLVPDRPRIVDVEFLIEPAVVTRLIYKASYPKPSGITRHLIDRESAVSAGQDVDVWERLVQLTRAMVMAINQG